MEAGDLVTLDVTAELDGYIADSAYTVAVPPVSSIARRLRDCAEAAFDRAIEVARAGVPVGAIGRAVEREVLRRGFSVLHELSGHGVGRRIHEPPTICNYDDGSKQLLTRGLVITIEPIVSAGADTVVTDDDGWTLRTADGSLSAHHEHTLVITDEAPVLLTAA